MRGARSLLTTGEYPSPVGLVAYKLAGCSHLPSVEVLCAVFDSVFSPSVVWCVQAGTSRRRQFSVALTAR